jgi:hypothetical protein
VKTADMPKGFDRYAAGQDFGLNSTFVKIGWLGEVIHVLCDYGAFNMTTKRVNSGGRAVRVISPGDLCRFINKC